MLARYRYRIEPDAAQRAMLARTFGCVRVVFNDAVRCWDRVRQVGGKIGPTEVQRRVITEAKNTDERAWLSEVASVALIQSVRDAHRALSNFLDSLSGRRRGRKVGRPRLKSRKDSLQSFRLTRNGKQRRLARLEREKARRAKGGRNRAKSRQRVAVQHVRIARARRDYHHKQALTLVRENQALHVEDLSVAAMVRNRRLAQAIHDAAWGQFLRLLEEKAERYGRTVHRVSRWLPSSKMCSSCGRVMDEMPLKIREWRCPGCGAMHDRDHNAAKNILAAGRAERRNACGAGVSPSSGEAVGDEAGSTSDAA